MSNDLRTYAASELRQHPRVAYQRLFDSDAQKKLLEAIPPLTSFRDEYVGAISVLDWDHKLPSDSIRMRIFGYYQAHSLASGQEAYDDRLELIGERDHYPEFDVPDFDFLVADEAYEIVVDLEGLIEGCRLTSDWRRIIDSKLAHQAVNIAKASKAFREIRAENTLRPKGLGELEAVSWTPPCESKHASWTVDIWYLLSFDGRLGAGQSLLVDLEKEEVVEVREFSVRAG